MNMHLPEPSINLMSVLLLIGSAQGVFLALVLVGMKKGNRKANRFLALLLLIFSISLIEGFMSVTYYYLRYPYLIGIEWPLTFVFGPLAYFYIKSLTSPQWRLKPWTLFAHFIPTVLYYISLIPFYRLLPEVKARLWYLGSSEIRNRYHDLDLILFIAIIQISAYLILSLRLLMVHSRNIRQTFSSVENISLSWLRTLIIVFFCLLCVYIFFSVFSQYYGVYKEAEYLLYLMFVIFIYVMGYKGIKQPEIFAPVEKADKLPGDNAGKSPSLLDRDRAELGSGETAPLPQEHGQAGQGVEKPGPILNMPRTEAEKAPPEKYRKSTLNEEQSEKILTRLILLMGKEKPYLEMELTLPELSNRLSLSPNHLSQVINGELKKSFFDFVNEYRVEEAKKLLLSPEFRHFSILGVAMEAGFNSKNAFYSAFKKFTGMTPSKFREHGKIAGHPKEPVFPGPT